MDRQTTVSGLIVLCALIAVTLTGCGSNDFVTAPDAPAAVSVQETFTDTVTINGARTHPFVNATTGAVTAVLTTVTPEGTHMGLSLGTWNGVACQIIIANDDAALASSVTGNASVGQFCVRLYDVGKLASATEYTVTVTHY